MVSTIDEARTPAELAEWLRVWADGYEEGIDYLDDDDARQLAEAVERVCTNGNVSALRDALEQALAYCESDQKSGIAYSDNDVLVPMLRAALAAPARNCDVGDAAEQSERLAKFCKTNYEKAKKDKHICSECQFNDCIGECPLKWAQLPFTPEKGGAE